MIIRDKNSLAEWLDQNEWFEDGFISKIIRNKANLTIRMGYQSAGTYIAGEPKELTEYELKPKNVSSWTWESENDFRPSYDSCIEGVDILEAGFGLKFETPKIIELACEYIEIEEPLTINTVTKPWISQREFFAKAHGWRSPSPDYWIKELKLRGLDVGFRYYCGEWRDVSRIPYPDYSGYYVQHLDKIDQTKEGVFLRFVNHNDSGLRMTIELKEFVSEDIFKEMQSIMSNWPNVNINCGNVSFTGEEWIKYSKTGRYPDKVERTKDIWQGEAPD